MLFEYSAEPRSIVLPLRCRVYRGVSLKHFSNLTIVLLFAFFSQAAYSRPFWTEKSSFAEGDRIFFVGVASRKATLEEGREEALRAARYELSNYLQSARTGGLTFNTQMTFDEKNDDGTFTVYRLMWVPKRELSSYRASQKTGRVLSNYPHTSVVQDPVPNDYSPSGWLIGVPFELTGLPVDVAGGGMFVLGFGLSVERQLWSVVSAHLGVSYHVGIGKNQDYDGLKYQLGFPISLSDTVYVSPDGGLVNTSYTSRIGVTQSFKLRQAFYGGSVGFRLSRKPLAGQLKLSLHRFDPTKGLNGRTAFVATLGILIDPVQ